MGRGGRLNGRGWEGEDEEREGVGGRRWGRGGGGREEMGKGRRVEGEWAGGRRRRGREWEEGKWREEVRGKRTGRVRE